MSFIEKFKVTLRKDHQQHFLIGLAVGLIGLTVENTDGDEFGTITELMQTGANDVLVIKLAEKQRLVPFLMNDVVKHIDMNKKRMLVDWDEDF